MAATLGRKQPPPPATLAGSPFTQEDPIGLAGGLNMYGYAGGDPVNFADPFGLCPPDWLCKLIGATAGQSAAEQYAAIATDPQTSTVGKVAATAGGLLASLWTPDTYAATATTLTTGLAVGKAAAALTRAGSQSAVQTAGKASADDLVESIAAQADEVKIGRTAHNAGDYVNIKFKDQSVLNVRVESHPPLGSHGNVQYWEKGVQVFNKHIPQK